MIDDMRSKELLKDVSRINDILNKDIQGICDIFVRVFRCPMRYPETFCFGGGVPVEFIMVDWFNTPDMRCLDEFIRSKDYYNPLYNHIVISEFGEVVSINGPRINQVYH